MVFGAMLRESSVTSFFDLLMIVGVLLAALLGIVRLRRGGVVNIACGGFAVLAIVEQPESLWVNYHALGRVFSPLLLLLAMQAVSERNRLLLRPMLLVLPRFLLQPVARIITLVL